jgi:hypothetical protein
MGASTITLLAGCLGIGCQLFGCDYEPIARPLRPRQLSTEHVHLLGTLDRKGEYLLLAREQADGTPSVAIHQWRHDVHCNIPASGEPLAAALERGAGAKGPALYLPLGVAARDASELVLVDSDCAVFDGYGTFAPRSVRSFVSRRDGHAFLVYRDPEATLFLVDPTLDLAPRRLAADVGSVRAGSPGSDESGDALWTVEAGRLTQRRLDGTRLLSLGQEVTGLALHPGTRRIAYVDAGSLYEAVAPKFAAKLIAPDGCSPRYTGDTIEFFSPCEAQALVRIRISSGKIETFAEGVFASSIQEGLQLDYVRAGEQEAQLFVEFGDGERRQVQPSFEAGSVYVLDEARLAGLDAQRRFGVWNRDDTRFTTLFQQVEELVPQHRGKSHTYSWLIYHDVNESGLGELTLLDAEGMRSTSVAQRVPRPALQGFVVINGNDLPGYPFSAPLVVALEEASAVAGQPELFAGRLKALSMRGDPSLVLAEGVSSYVLVASPVPGVLYGVEDGAERGLWYTPL